MTIGPCRPALSVMSCRSDEGGEGRSESEPGQDSDEEGLCSVFKGLEDCLDRPQHCDHRINGVIRHWSVKITGPRTELKLGLGPNRLSPGVAYSTVHLLVVHCPVGLNRSGVAGAADRPGRASQRARTPGRLFHLDIKS